MPQTHEPHAGSSAGTGEAWDSQAKAQDAAEQAQEKAQAAAGQAQAKLREQLDRRSSQVAGQINEQVSDLRSVGKALREQGKDGPAQAADRLAGYAEKVGGYLRDRDSEALLHDAEDFGRRQPAAVAVSGLLVGFLTSRFLKASSGERYSSRGATALPSALSPAAPRTPRGDDAGGGSALPIDSLSQPVGGPRPGRGPE